MADIEKRGVTFDQIVAHVEATMEFRWYPLRDFTPSKFAARYARHYEFLRNVKHYTPAASAWLAVRMSCKDWFNPRG